MSSDMKERIVEMHKKGMAPFEIERETGYGRQQIRKVLRSIPDLNLTNTPRGRRQLDDIPSFGPLHIQLGQFISCERTFRMKLSRREAAEQFRMSHIRLLELEQGKYDPTLGELLRISQALNTPLADLIRYKELARVA